MKTIKFFALIATLALFTTTSLFAQGGGGMGGGMRGGMGGPGGGMMGGPGGGMQRQQLTPEQIVASTGLFVIDAKDIIDECKIKDGDTAKKVTEIVAVYNSECNRIMNECALQLDSLEDSANIKPNMEDMSAMRKQMMARMRTMQSVREKTTPMHKALNDSMTAIFEEKDAKRWESCYKKICRDNSYRAGGDRPQRGGQGQRMGN